MSQNPKKFNDKPMKLICSICQEFSVIKVKCNQCSKEYCSKCWHTFKVRDFGYRPYKNGCYTSNRCGGCVVEWKEGVAEDDSFEGEYIPEIIKNDNGTWTDELTGKTGIISDGIKEESDDEVIAVKSKTEKLEDIDDFDFETL